MTNINCLHGLACPKCGHDECLVIAVSSLASVTDEGTDMFGATEWAETSYCECPECQHHGTVSDFRIHPQPSTNEGESL